VSDSGFRYRSLGPSDSATRPHYTILLCKSKDLENRCDAAVAEQQGTQCIRNVPGARADGGGSAWTSLERRSHLALVII
jgi:hypothetical protein